MGHHGSDKSRISENEGSYGGAEKQWFGSSSNEGVFSALCGAWNLRGAASTWKRHAGETWALEKGAQ